MCSEILRAAEGVHHLPAGEGSEVELLPNDVPREDQEACIRRVVFGDDEAARPRREIQPGSRCQQRVQAARCLDRMGRSDCEDHEGPVAL